MLSGTHGAATRVCPARADGTCPGKIRRPSARSVPQAKQVGNGCEVCPGYAALAATASSQETASTGSTDSSPDLGLGDQRAAEGQLETVVVRGDPHGRVQGRWLAQRHRHGPGAGLTQLVGQRPRDVAAVAGPRRTAVARRHEEGVLHARTHCISRGSMGNNGRVSDLIDTTEMYLRTIYELVEEGIVPLRARIAERLHQSGPTVSQTVARMERDGLVTVEGDRHLQLTEEGNSLATRVMRKHRLAERLLTDVIGLDWELVHEEACRWEHVMSETVERRLLELLDHPTESPYGNPIPGLAELGEAGRAASSSATASSRWPTSVGDGLAPGAGAPDQRGDAEGRGPDGALRRAGAIPVR